MACMVCYDCGETFDIESDTEYCPICGHLLDIEEDYDYNENFDDDVF